MIEFTRINHIHVCVPLERLEEARLFYSNIIGLQQIERPDVFPAPGYWFSIGDIELHIGIEEERKRSIRHTAFEVADIAAAEAYLKKNGIEVMNEPHIPGRHRFSFFDPFGNRMELLQMIDK
jgi:4-hydroxyphenylpyruvate dioxygenase-like putative hemolysin